MKVYVCGPMTGVPHFNFPAFVAAVEDLREKGFEVVSPHELDSPSAKKAAEESLDGDPSHYADNDSWGNMLARDVKIIADRGVEAIVCLPGWENSRGAKLETFVGRLCGLQLLEYPNLNKIHVDLIDDAHGHKDSSFKRLLDATHQTQEDVFKPDEYDEDDVEITGPGEVRVTDKKTGGQKGAKQAVLGDLDPGALMETAKVCGFGRKKYERLNYLKGYDWSLSYDALQRHLHAFWGREETDKESGLAHLAHAAWHCFALLSFSRRGLGTDDRP